MRKHLVLGSRGQIGAYLVDRLKSVGDEVVEWDIEISDEHDLVDRSLVQKNLEPVMADCDYVHFLAFDVGGSTYLAKYQNTFDFVSHNMNIMENVFSLLAETQKPFYFASSQMSNMFHSTYGRLKAVGESYTNSLKNGKNLRFWNIYGYEADPEKTHVITDFVKMALRDGRILIKTDGSETRNFLYAKDAAVLLEGVSKFHFKEDTYHDPNLLTEFNALAGAVPIVSSSRFISILDIANKVKNLVGDNVEIYASPTSRDNVQGITNNPPYILSLNKWLGLIQETPLHEGINEIVEKIKNESK